MQTLDQLFDELDLLKRAAQSIAEQNLRMRDLLTRMLDPEDLGYAVSNEVRAEIKKVVRRAHSN